MIGLEEEDGEKTKRGQEKGRGALQASRQEIEFHLGNKKE